MGYRNGERSREGRSRMRYSLPTTLHSKHELLPPRLRAADVYDAADQRIAFACPPHDGPDMTPCDRRPIHHRRRFCRALIMAFTAIGLAVGAACPVAAFNAEATRFYEDAVGRLERDDVAGAIIQLNNALQKDPGMLAAHVLLGKARLRNADPEGAEVSFDKALRLGFPVSASKKCTLPSNAPQITS